MLFTCCSREEFDYWADPKIQVDPECDSLTPYKPGQYGNHPNKEHGFCKEADHQKCRELRAKGLCMRTSNDYEKMVRDVSRRKLMI